MSKQTSITKSEKSESALPFAFGQSVANLALDVADRGQSTTIALLQEGRAEVATLVTHTIELAEKATTSVFRLARKATTRFDEVANETLASVERILGHAVRHVRDTRVNAPAEPTVAKPTTANN